MAKVECPIEDVECEIFHNWLEQFDIPHTHIPNESKIQAKAAIVRGKKLKRLGVSPGYWDYDVYIPVLDFCGEVGGYELVKIEMRRAKKNLSKVSKSQLDWGNIYDMTGIECHICYGAEAAEQVVSEAYERINHEKLKLKPIDF
jgi:hypothetical protein